MNTHHRSINKTKPYSLAPPRAMRLSRTCVMRRARFDSLMQSRVSLKGTILAYVGMCASCDTCVNYFAVYASAHTL